MIDTSDVVGLATAKISTLFFVLAILHTFCATHFNKLAKRFKEGSIAENLLHLLGEVEIIFGLWAFLFLGALALRQGADTSIAYLSSLNFSEAVFVFVIMCLSASRPILNLAERVILALSKVVPLPTSLRYYCTLLIIGPLLGSFITEPAAMTVCALLLKDRFFSKTDTSLGFKYATLALLFVNISIGGTLTHFAAPPVLMVASPWSLTLPFMFFNFGLKAALAIFVGTLATAFIFKKTLQAIVIEPTASARSVRVPFWLTVTHIAFMVTLILQHEHPIFCLAVFMLFVGWAEVTKEYQSALKIREGLLVGFFLAGLVALGKLQGWWLGPLLQSLGDFELFVGATTLTAITDNAALTYLGSLVPNLSDSAKYMLLAGAVTGGGLTVIANAPNPVGLGILNSQFGDVGVSPLKLFLAALPYTLLAACSFYFL